MTDRPAEKPLAEWPPGWLKLEVANILANPGYLILSRDEKLEQDLPETVAEMRAFIELSRKAGTP